MKDKFFKLFPKYIFLPLFLAMFFNYITYFCTTSITDNFYHYNIYSQLDEMIPFVPWFITIYILAYIQWGLGYIVITRENKKVCYKYVSADLVAKFCCLIFFFVLPTTINRPEVGNSGFINFLVRLIYNSDSPVNLFPSIHCLESWMVFRGGLACKKVPKGYNIIMFIFTILVCLSTVFVKQHVVIDIIGGILVAEFGILIANRFNTGRFLAKANLLVLKIKDDKNGKEKSKKEKD